MNTALQDAPLQKRELAVSLLRGKILERVLSIPPDLSAMSIEELEATRKPTEIDYFLKKNLWKQVDLAEKGAIKEIENLSVYGGVCSAQNFDAVMENPTRLAWIMVPPTADLERATFGFQVGLTNLIKFVSKEPTAETAGAFLKAMEMLWNRVHGSVAQLQRIDKRSAHVNLNKPVAAPTSGAANRLEELKQKILEQRDVTPEGEGDAT